MKIKCTNIYNEHIKKLQDESYWLTVGNEYTVLEMLIYPGKNILYRLVGDNENKMPALYDAKQFTIISNKISTAWSISQLPSGSILCSPASWRELGFWERCYDGDPAALERYKREARIIFDEENSP